MATINSKWANDPIDLSNSLNHSSWADAATMEIANGKLIIKNDATYLYIAFDMTGDTINDPIPAPADGDYFWLLFDRDKSGALTTNSDVLYSPYKTNTNKLGRSFLLTASSTTGMTEQIESQCRSAFEASPNSATAHKVFKVRLKIADLTVTRPIPFPIIPILLRPSVKFGLRYHSTTPNMLVESPANPLAAIASFHTIFLALRPTIPLTDLGPVMGSVGLIPTTKINSVTGKATTSAGYYVEVNNASFAGGLNIISNRTQLQSFWAAGARKYKVKKRFTTAGTFTEFRSAWTNYRWNGTDYILESYGADAAGYYSLPDPAIDYSIDDLLVQFNSAGLENGIHQFQVEFYREISGIMTLVPSPSQTLTLAIDNAVPQVMINNITHGGANVDRCGIVNLSGPTDGLRFNITANDPEGNLLSYSLIAGWGNGQSEGIFSKSYDPTTMGTSWSGETITVPTAPAVWSPDEKCAHSFTLSASSNTTNGYGMVGYNTYSQYITLLLP